MFQISDKELAFKVWGLEDRPYSDDEIKASAHLQAAVNAGALVKDERAAERLPARSSLRREQPQMESSQKGSEA